MESTLEVLTTCEAGREGHRKRFSVPTFST